MRWVIFGLSLYLGAISCGDNLAGTDAGTIDAVPGDAAKVICQAFAENTVGGSCTTPDGVQTQCLQGGPGAYCLENQYPPIFKWPSDGFCTAFGCMSDDDCGDRGTCVTVNQGTAGEYSACMPECCAGETCPTDMVCQDTLYGTETLSSKVCLPAREMAADGDSCTTFADCAPGSRCRRDANTYPGGYCWTQDCTVGDDTTCNGGRCVALPDAVGLNVCVKDCNSNLDCRMDEGYRCIDGSAQGLGKYCDHPNIGDACTVSDEECGTGASGALVCDTTKQMCTKFNCPTVGSREGCSDRSLCYDDAPGGADPFCADECDPTDPDEPDCRIGFICTAIAGDPNGRQVCLPD